MSGPQRLILRSISPHARFAITLHFVLLSLGTAHASPFSNYGFGAVGTSSAGALTTSATDYHSVFYNPAQLLAKKRVHMGLGTAYIAPNLVIEQNKADSIYQAVVPKQNVGIHLGLSAPVAGPFKRKLALGIGFFIPLIQNSRVEALDPHTPQAYMYQSLPDRIFLGLGAAYELHPTLHLGVGFQVLASLDGTAEASLSVVQQRVTRRTLRVDFFGEIAPIAGLSWRPMDSFKVGLAYRGALGFAYNLPIKLEIEEVGVLDFQAKGVSLWDPDVVDFGASWFLDDWDLTISATLSWALWSSAPAPNNIMSVMIDDSFLQGGESVESDALIWVKTDPIDLGMTDIFIPRISFLWRPNAAWHIRTGYAFRPTPLPHATGAATYLDASTHIIGLGTGWTIGDPTRVQDEPLTIELAAQWQHLQPRSSIKKDAENATGDVRILGDVMVFQLEVHHDF
jgi:long-subunit fatty acid transport protein